MDQMWSCIYTLLRTPGLDLIGYPKDDDVTKMRQLLRKLHSHGVDWTDPSAWPEDFIDGQWEQPIPIPFLLEKPGFRSKSSTNLICGICEGDLDQQAVPLYLVGITAVHLRMLFSLSLWHLFVSHGCKVLLVLGLQS